MLNAYPKPQRGTHVLEKEAKDAASLALERLVKAIVKKDDTWTCRWPEPHRCRKGLEAAHLKDASLGGRMVPENLITVCGWIHRRGPESIHGKQLQIEAETAKGARGPCSFWRQGADGIYFMVARESAIGVIDKD